MKMYKLGEYLDEYDTLTPTIEALANADWWTATAPQFDDLIWMYYYDRELLGGQRFNSNNSENNYNNIMRTFRVYLTANARRYERLFDAFMADFNVLWNVDGVTGTIQEQTHTGTDTYKKTGDDTLKNSGTDTNVKSGSQDDSGDGYDKVTHHYDSYFNRTGTSTDKYYGQETNTTEVTTYDDSNLITTEKVTTGYGEELQGTQKEVATDYDDLKDTHTGDDWDKTELNSTKTLTFNDVTDEYTHGKQEKTTYNSTDTNTKNLSDKFVEMVIRQGNIGVTESTTLIQHALELFNCSLYDFYKTVIRDCVNQVTYRVY